MPHAAHGEPFFITEEIAEEMKTAGYVFEPPAHVSTTNARELFGLCEGETFAQAIARASTGSTE